MTWTPWLTSLNDVLADLYPTTNDTTRILACASIKSSLINLDVPPLVRWFNVLKYLESSHGNRLGHPPKAMALVDCALKTFEDQPVLLALKNDEPPVVKGADLNWVGAPDESHLEKILGARSTLLPIRFLEIGVNRARSVARVVRADRSSGTGFLIGGGWLLTNNHVLPTVQISAGATAEFNYQQTLDGVDAAVDSYPLDASRFHTSVENDWTVIGIESAAEAKWGTIKLEAVDTNVAAFVNIVQHAGGGPKQIGLYHNTVAWVGDGRVQYLTDTLPGSSGSPVFDDQWRVVALHHSGGMLREPGTKNAFYRNEGISIRQVIHDLRTFGVTQ